MYTGIVKFYKADKAYGFIIENETKKEYFFHITDVDKKQIQKEDVVSFDLIESKRGIKASNVKRV